MIPSPETRRPSAAREILISRIFAAPRSLVYRTWTDPSHISSWWGPRGFSTTTSSLDLRPGGMWIYVMHGPDGRDYENWIRYITIVPEELLHYDHGGGSAEAPAHFQVTVAFTELKEHTLVSMLSVFPSAEARDQVVRYYGAIEGGYQTMARLAEQLAGAAGRPAGRSFVFRRTVAAPRELVYRAWTQPDMLSRWWGPKGFTIPHCVFEAEAGGRIHIDMRAPDGTVYPMGGTVLEVTPPDRLAFLAIALGAQGVHELENLTIVTFAESGGHTTVSVEVTVQNATARGENHLKGMDAGWTSSLVRLEAAVASLDGNSKPRPSISSG
jgi:uncharacterized protein YndB with AHSA1/START domain